MKKMIVFDMDGTIADLYNVNNWLGDLRSENVRPYVEAKPMYNMEELASLLLQAKLQGFIIAVTTWLAKESSKEYKKAVTKAKKEWLANYNFPYDEIHLVAYGTTKANCTRKKAEYQVLVDDNAQVRKGWTLGDTINANENIIPELKELLQIA